MWLNELQIAIVEQDTDKIDKLLDSMPEFDTQADIEKASYLLKAAFELMVNLKDETLGLMNQLKTNREFLKSAQTSQDYKLDIKS